MKIGQVVEFHCKDRYADFPEASYYTWGRIMRIQEGFITICFAYAGDCNPYNRYATVIEEDILSSTVLESKVPKPVKRRK